VGVVGGDAPHHHLEVGRGDDAVDPQRGAPRGEADVGQVGLVESVVGDAGVAVDLLPADLADQVLAAHRLVHAGAGEDGDVLGAGAGGVQLAQHGGEDAVGGRGAPPVVRDQGHLLALEVEAA
jgi:hypothetical protein